MLINSGNLNTFLRKLGFVSASAATPSTLALRDANGTVAANNFAAAATTTPTAAGTTTLTVASTRIQFFSGVTTQTVVLPTASVPLGYQHVLSNFSTGVVTVNASNGSPLWFLSPSETITVTAVAVTPTAPSNWLVHELPSYAVSQTAVASTLAVRDGNGNLLANAFLPASATTVTAGGTTTLVASSKQDQFFTGTSAQTCVLPTTSVPVGATFTIVNQGTNFVTVNSSGGNLISYVAAGTNITVKANAATPTTAAHWTITAYPGSTLGLLGTAVIRDNSGFANYANAQVGSTITATSAGTLTLSYGGNITRTQIFTGSTTHTCVLPSAGIGAGTEFLFVNQSSGIVTVNASAGALVSTVAAAKTMRVVCTTATPTTAAHWTILSMYP